MEDGFFYEYANLVVGCILIDVKDIASCYDLVTYGVLNRSKDKGVSGIKYFKNKWYWLLMPPFFVAAIVTFFVLLEGQGHYAFLVILIFWIVYYTVNHFSKKQLD